MEHGTTLLPTGYDLNICDGRDVSRRIFLKGIGGIACLGFVPILQACDNVSQGGKGKEMAITGSVAHAMRPPIDASAPAQTQQATFALG